MATATPGRGHSAGTLVANRTGGFGGGGGDDPEDDPNRINKILEQAKRRGRASPGVAPEPPWKKQKQDAQAAIAACLQPGETFGVQAMEEMRAQMLEGLMRALTSQGRRGFAFPPLPGPVLNIVEIEEIDTDEEQAHVQPRYSGQGGKAEGKGRTMIPGCTPQTLPLPKAKAKAKGKGTDQGKGTNQGKGKGQEQGKGTDQGKGNGTEDGDAEAEGGGERQQTTRNNRAGHTGADNWLFTGRCFFFFQLKMYEDKEPSSKSGSSGCINP